MLLKVLLLTCSLAIAQQCNVCIVKPNETSSRCPAQSHTASNIDWQTVTTFSSLDSQHLACRVIYMYLTGGVHHLTRNVSLAGARSTTIVGGTVSESSSTLECRNGAGLYFGNYPPNLSGIFIERVSGITAFIANVTFKNCSSNHWNS